MQTTMTITIIVYLAIMLGIGIYFAQKNKNANDFLVANKSLPTWVAVLTMTATMFGGGAIVGRTQVGYNYGFMGVCVCFIPVFGQTILSLIVEKMHNFTKFRTVSEFLEDRYQSVFVRTACALLSIIALIGIASTQVAAITSVLSALGFGNPKVIAFICVAVIMLLTVIGGILAVSYTDSLQIGIVIVGLIILMGAVLKDFGGLGGVFTEIHASADALPEDYTTVTSLDKIMWALKMMIPGIMYTLVGQDAYQRLFSCKDMHSAKITCRCAGLLICLLSLPAILFGLVGRLNFPELATQGTSASTLAYVIMKYLPNFLGAIFLCAVLSAILSTADSLLTAATSHFISDFYVRFFKKDADFQGKELLRVSRIFTIVAGIFALVMSFGMDDIVSIMNHCYTLYTGGAFMPVLLGALWPKANKYGASAGLVVGCAVGIAGIRGFTLGFIPGELLAALSCMIVMVVVSLATQNKIKAVENN